MRNNPYKSMIKVLTPKKNDRLVIQRVGDDVYMTETHVAFKIRYSLYTTWIHSEKPFVFPALNDGDCLSNGEPCEMNVKACMKGYDENDRFDAIPTDFLKAINDSLARMIYIETSHGENVPMLINESFYQTVVPFLDDSDCKVWCNGSHRYPLWVDCDAMTALLLPVNYKDATTEHGKALATLANIETWSAKNRVA